MKPNESAGDSGRIDILAVDIKFYSHTAFSNAMRRRLFLGTVGSTMIAGCSSDSTDESQTTGEDTSTEGTETSANSSNTESSGEPAFEQAWELDRGPEEVEQLVVGSDVVLWETSDASTVCNDLASGTERWRREKFYENKLYPTADRIYGLPGGEQVIEALDPQSGEAEWTVPLSDVIGEGAVEGARASGLAIPVPNGVAVSANGLEESGSAILDADSGEILARIRQGGQRRQLSDPAQDGNQLFTSSGRPLFFAYDLEAYEVQWSIDRDSFTTGNPGKDGFAVGPERVFTPAQTQNEYGQSAVPARAYDRDDGSVEWEVEASDQLKSPYGYAGGELVFVGQNADPQSVGVNPATGEIQWTYSHDSRPNQHPIFTDRGVIVLEQGGPLVALDPQSGEPLSTVDVSGEFIDGTDSHVFVGGATTETGYICYRY